MLWGEGRDVPVKPVPSPNEILAPSEGKREVRFWWVVYKDSGRATKIVEGEKRVEQENLGSASPDQNSSSDGPTLLVPEKLNS
jgi:hypothetical protein